MDGVTDGQTHGGLATVKPGHLCRGTEACLYRILRERFAKTIAFSVGHRGTLRPFHTRHFVVQPNGSGLASIV